MLPSLVALGLAGIVTTASSSEPARSLTVHLLRRCPPAARCLPRKVVMRMMQEIEWIWSAADVRIVWIESVAARPAASSAGLTIMLEEGVYPDWAATHTAVLAAVNQPSDACGWGLARVWVRHVQRHVALVRREGHPFATLPAALTDMLLGRALGRAAAHEIGHYLLGTASHSAHGLMRAYFGPQELLEESIRPLYAVSAGERAALVSCRIDPMAPPRSE